MDAKSVQELIEQGYDNFTPQIRRAAKYVLSAPTEVALYPLRTIADNAKVSPSALVRLSTQLGFDTYNEFRDLFRHDISRARGPARYAVDAEEMIASGQDDQLTAKANEAIAGVLDFTRSLLDAALIERIKGAAECVDKANRVFIVGLRNNQAAAFYFYYISRFVRKGIVLVSGRHGMLIDELGEMERGDVAIVMSYEPYALDAVRAAEFASEAGVQVVSLTDSTVSPIAPMASHLLVTPRISASFYQSSIPTLAVLETLIYFLVAKGGQDTVLRVSREFKRLAELGAYWDEGPNRK